MTPLLDQVHEPADMRGFEDSELRQLADELRTATIAAVLLACQLLMHPVWTLAGDRIAKTLAGTPAEPYLMYTLAALTVASVLFVLFGGGT